MKITQSFSKMLVLAALAATVTTAASSAERGPIPMLSGGVGLDSAAQIKLREKEFNFKLVITLIEGDYVFGARVSISAAGKVIATHVADGPFFLARLPAGSYSVTLDYAGQSQTRKMVLRADRLTTEYVRFKRDAGDAPTPRE